MRSLVPDPFKVDLRSSNVTSNVLFGNARPGARQSTFDSAFNRVKSNFGGEDVESDQLATRYGDETFTYDPTRSICPPRPRTLRAGWVRPKGSDTGTIVVQFREGAVYEYNLVPYNVWRNFRRVKSPGRLINRTLNSYPYLRVSG